MIDDSAETQRTGIGYNAKIRDRLAEIDPELLLADGFDECVVGWCYTPGPGYRAVYDTEKIIETLVKRDGLSFEEAWEYFEFNTEGAYVGEKTPVFWRKLEDLDSGTATG